MGNSLFQSDPEVKHPDSFFVYYATPNYIYFSETSEEKIVQAYLKYTIVLDSADLQKPKCFRILDKRDYFTFCAESQEEADDWVCMLKKGIK